MNVWRCIVLVLCLSAGTSYAQTSFNARTWLFTQNVTRAASEARFLQWFQAESLELNILAREETNVLHQLGALDLSATNLLHVWECAAETNIHTVYFAVTGTVQDATNGHVRYRVTPAAANLLAGNYLGFARVLQTVNGTNVRMGVLQQHRMQVIESVDSELYDIVGPISSTDYVQRIDYGGQSGATPQITRTGNVVNIRWPAAGAGDMLTSIYDADTNNVVDNAQALGGTAAAAYATDSEVTAATNALTSNIAVEASARAAADTAIAGTVTTVRAIAEAATASVAAVRGELGTASNALQSAINGKAATSHAHTGPDITDGTISNADLAAGAVTSTTIADGTVTPSDVSFVVGAWSNRIEFLNVTNASPCGLRLVLAYSGAAVHAVTGCTSYITLIDTNGPAATGGAATNYTVVYNGATNTGSAIVLAAGGSVTNVVVTNGQIVVQSKDEAGSGGDGVTNIYDLHLVDAVTPSAGEVLAWSGAAWTNATDQTSNGGSNLETVAAWSLLDAQTYTAQYAVIRSGQVYDRTIPLVVWDARVDGGTATVDLINFAVGAGAWTTNSTLLVVGHTSMTPAASLAASNLLGFQIRAGATITNRFDSHVRGWR